MAKSMPFIQTSFKRPYESEAQVVEVASSQDCKHSLMRSAWHAAGDWWSKWAKHTWEQGYHSQSWIWSRKRKSWKGLPMWECIWQGDLPVLRDVLVSCWGAVIGAIDVAPVTKSPNIAIYCQAILLTKPTKICACSEENESFSNLADNCLMPLFKEAC